MILEDLRLSKIKQVVNVHSEAGRRYDAVSRPMYALTFCKSGEIVYTQNGNVTVQKHDRVLLLPKFACYKLKGTVSGDFPLINFECQEDFGDGKIHYFEINNNDIFLKKFEHLKQAFESGKNSAKISAIFYEIVSDIIDTNTLKDTPISLAVNYINHNFTQISENNKDLANICGISEIYFRKLFKKYYGITPKQYILNLRIQKAKSLLCEYNKTVTEISEACGFSSVYHFCRIFKEKTGITPSEYKNFNI